MYTHNKVTSILINLSKIELFVFDVQMYNCTDVQIYGCTDVQVHRCTMQMTISLYHELAILE